MLPDVLRFAFGAAEAVERGAADVHRAFLVACVDMLAAAAECCATAGVVAEFALTRRLLRYMGDPELRIRACEGLYWLCSRRLDGASHEFSVQLFTDVGGAIAAYNLEPSAVEMEFQRALCRAVVALGVRHVNVLALSAAQDLVVFASYVSLLLRFASYPGPTLLALTCEVWQMVLSRPEHGAVVRARSRAPVLGLARSSPRSRARSRRLTWPLCCRCVGCLPRGASGYPGTLGGAPRRPLFSSTSTMTRRATRRLLWASAAAC